ncbi:hypothetical protein [Pseudobacteroides cellulosolvens]|uniref:SWIM-type domain-containing protein n=1 Tax=Pseudobacteroides cellulosolvens ATCC 35603 = DSM 2933 TaxID=398512 RepID=A0A0L6JR51_9FIRM|nr:hypothetical protein [Pseudobacteroides cellulosolvens]KNY28175.1 hypothetical protein Bccel_3449 [Pseudobacteroides cellulosolvens ATCC 35603 = DSM 2933]
MQVNYQYASPSMCIHNGDQTVLGLSPDLSRAEKVSFVGTLKKPLIFRDAMLMLRQIVISDTRQKKKERTEFFTWLNEEIERQISTHEKYMSAGLKSDLQNKINDLQNYKESLNIKIDGLAKAQNQLKKEIDKYDVWSDYYKLERKFWQFIKARDINLWYVLDPVITVHPDQVSFEAFSLDESTYGCLSVNMDEFQLKQQPQLGTTNIDFSDKLAREMERFRTYTNVELSVNPGGFTIDSGVMPEYVEKKIDLPESWIKGFNQVSGAASLGGVDITLTPVDMYDICSFLRRFKANKSPRYMKWILEPEKPVKIVFEPFGKAMELQSVYHGKKKREEKIWGRRRWLVIEKIIPHVKSFTIRLLGFGMPQFIIGDMGSMKMTIGFSSWSSNDWVKGTAFNILGGFIGNGNYESVYSLLKEHRFLSVDSISEKLNSSSKTINKAGVGMLLRRGEGYFDPVLDVVRFRQLCNVPIDKSLYETTNMEIKVQEHMQEGMSNFTLKVNNEMELIAANVYKDGNAELVIDQDGQISKVKCKCSEFNRGSGNISEPCSHILALYATTSKFMQLEFRPDREYKINDILEMLL